MANVYNVDYDTAIRVVRSEPNKILVDNDAMVDPRISWGAKMLWTLIINMPENADLSLDALKREVAPRGFSYKETQVFHDELFAAGYLMDDGL